MLEAMQQCPDTFAGLIKPFVLTKRPGTDWNVVARHQEWMVATFVQMLAQKGFEVWSGGRLPVDSPSFALLGVSPVSRCDLELLDEMTPLVETRPIRLYVFDALVAQLDL